MTITTIYSSPGDGHVNSQHATYSTARSGGSMSVANNPLYVGQLVSGDYNCIESFTSFDTSSIPDGATITQVDFSLYLVYDYSTTDFTVQVFTRSWTSGGLTTADFVPGADISALTLLATLYSSGIGSTGSYKTFSENGSNFRNAINKTGNTELLIASSRHASGNTPTGDEILWFAGEASYPGTATDPKLVITYIENTNYTKSTSGTMGTLTGALSAGHTYTQAIAGAISSLTSTLARTANKVAAGSITSTGTVSKLATKSFSGAAGTLSGAMSYIRVILHQITGTTGALSGTVSDLQTGFGVNLTGAIESVSGSISRSVRKSVSGAFAATGKVFKMNTFRSAIIKAGTVVRKTIQSGRDY